MSGSAPRIVACARPSARSPRPRRPRTAPATRGPAPGREVRVVRTGAGDDLCDLALDECDRLAWDGPALCLEHAARGIARELLPAVDERCMHAAASDISVRRVRAQPAVELFDPHEHPAHLRVASIPRWGREPCAARLRLDLEMDEAAMRDGELHLRRLRDDRGICAHAGGNRLGADARVLLVGDRGQDHIAAQPAPFASAVASMHAARLPSCRTSRARTGARPRCEARTDRPSRRRPLCPCAR